LVQEVRNTRETSEAEALSFRPPLAVAPLIGFLGARAIPGVEQVRGSTYRRTLATEGGPAVIAVTPKPGRVELLVTPRDDETAPAAVRSARRLFDLDADPAAVERTLRRDPVLRPIVRANPGIRVPGAADGFELVVRAILGQQVSVAAARTMLGRVAARFGTPVAGAHGEIVTMFPGPELLADAPVETLGITGRRARTIRRVAAMVAMGELDLTERADPDETIGALLELDGVGPWTAAYVRMRALRDPDAFPGGDLGLRRAFAKLGLDASPRAIAERAERWRPWRAYAAILLWTNDG
jgi:AraC family transcriptional regulator of adaptative response / DNA-3-methyladenine glycosylase II